jgi:hypothetical protein
MFFAEVWFKCLFMNQTCKYALLYMDFLLYCIFLNTYKTSDLGHKWQIYYIVKDSDNSFYIILQTIIQFLINFWNNLFIVVYS